MLKYRMVYLCMLLISSFAYAMQEDNDKICYLSYVPDDVLNRIAFFLWEYDTEFIERTRVPKKLWKSAYCGRAKHYFHVNDLVVEDTFESHDFDKLNGWTPDMRMMSMFTSGKIDWYQKPEVIVVDFKNSEIMIKKQLKSNAQYKNVAVANGGKMMALYYQKKTMDSLDDIRPNEVDTFYEFTSVLELQKMTGEVKKMPQLPHNFIVTHLAFNQQTTKFIVHGRDIHQQDLQHILFPLKNVQDPIYQDEPMTLNRYFNHKGVCKEIVKLSGK